MFKILIASLFLLVSASAAWADARKDCEQKEDTDRRIRGCTALIRQDPRDAVAYLNRGSAYGDKGDYDLSIADHTKAIELDPKDEVAYNNRGNAYGAKGDYDGAIADYSKAIELDPKAADAYMNRGVTYKVKGDYDLAIADYTKIIELEPEYWGAYRNRGYARFYEGDFKDAGADLLRVIELKDDIYLMLLRYLARSRAGEDAASELEANAARLKTKDWPYPVIELYLGKREPEAALSSAAKPDERCDAHFYVGEWHVLQNNRDEAAKALQVAKDTCPKNFFEYTAAVAELKRLGDTPKEWAPSATQGATAPDVAAPTKTSGASQEMELGFWNSVKDSDDPAMLQAYLDQFPNGTFVSIAKLKVEKLKKAP